MTHEEYKDRFPTVAVIGAGTMGAGIAQLAATHGHQVLLFDVNAPQLDTAMTKMMATMAKLVAKGKFTEQQVTELRQRITLATDLKELADADLVIEAIIEDLAIKRSLFAELETLVSPGAILASNTSSLSISAIAQGMTHPDRFLGMHFFNPAPVMKLVEVVAGIDSDPDLVEQVKGLATSWRKVAVIAKSTPGFIVNRVARPYYAEALRMVEEGFARPDTIDAVLTGCGGFRMGPFTLTDLIGHDVNYAVTASVYDAFYQDSWFRPSLVQKDLVDAGHLGRKSGKGFYDYSDPSAVHVAPEALAHPVPAGASSSEKVTAIGSGESPLQPLMDRLREHYGAEGVRTLHSTAKGTGGLESGELRLGDDIRLLLCDGRLAEQHQADSSGQSVCVIDICGDLSQTPWLYMAGSSRVTDEHKDRIAQCFAPLGIRVIFGADSPGLIVLRTVAMLANLGFDAAFKGVCSLEDVDNAMRYGVNYPKGPIQWAKEVGIPRIRYTLRNLYELYQDDRYRLSYPLAAPGHPLTKGNVSK